METCNRHTTEQIPWRPLKQFRRPCETALASTNTNYNSTIALTHFPRPAGVLSTDSTSLFSVDEYVFFVSTKTFYFVKMHTYGSPRKIQKLRNVFKKHEKQENQTRGARPLRRRASHFLILPLDAKRRKIVKSAQFSFD